MNDGSPRAAERHRSSTSTNLTPAVFVICAADEQYAPALAVMMESLACHVGPGSAIEIHIVDCGLSEDSRAAISLLARSNVSISWRQPAATGKALEISWGHVSKATFQRLLIGEWVPAHARSVLWLDCDLMVLDDVARLVDVETGDGVLAAVRDPFVRQVSSHFGVRNWSALGFQYDDPYFNAGVMRIDMQKWRSANVGQRALDYLSRFGSRVYFNEQEALNAVLRGRWRRLEDRWNVSVNPFHSRGQRYGGRGPAIVHFCGRVKPWALPDLGGFQDQWFEYLDRTAWRNTRPAAGLKNRIISWYVGSRLRFLTYGLENQYLKLQHVQGRFRAARTEGVPHGDC